METSVIPSLNSHAEICIIEAPRTAYELPEIQITTATPVRIIEVQNPFRLEDRRELEIQPLDNESVAAIVSRAGLRSDDYECSLNGNRMGTGETWSTAVRPGNEIVLFPRVAGGNWWHSALGMVAGLIAVGLLLFFCPVLLAAGAFAIGAMFAGGAMIGGAVMSWALAPGLPKQPDYSTTYDPTGPKGQAQPGVPVPKGYGTMGWCGNIISSYVSYAGKDAYINALACYGWGGASKITGIQINKKDISTYTNTSYYVRYGTNDQEPIDGFNKTVNGFPQETQLLVANGPVVVPGTGTGVQGLEATIKLPAGLYHISANGNFVPINVTYKLEVSRHGTGAWQSPLFPRNYGPITTTRGDGSLQWPKWVVMPTDRFKGSGIVYAYDDGPHTPGDYYSANNNVDTYDYVGNHSVTSETFEGEWQPCDPNLGLQQVNGWWNGYRVLAGDNVNAFFDTVQILGLSAGQWDLRVTKIGYQEPGQSFVSGDSTDSHYVTDIWLWNVNEITFSDLAYPNMILVGIHALATSQLSGAALQVQATITHELGEDTVLPPELAGFEHDNPALVAYDVLTNPVYGMNVAASLIDVPAFVAWANFADEPVTNQDGSTARRFVFAGVFDQTSDAWKVLQTIGNMSRASVYQIGMRYSVVLDAPAQPVQLFTVANTKRGSFQEMWVSLDDRSTLIECDFADAARNWRMDLPVSVMTAEDINSGMQPKTTRTRLIGCTSRDQAWRWSYFNLLSSKLTLRSIQFDAAMEAVVCRVGSVIAVQSDVTQWATGGRIKAGSTTSSLIIDRYDMTFAAGQGWTVSVQHPVVSRGTVNLLSVAENTVTVNGLLPAARILKFVTPDGTEYIVTGTSSAAGNGVLTVAFLGQLRTALPGTPLALYDMNVIDDVLVSSVTPTTDGGAVISLASGALFSAVPTPDSPWVYGKSSGFQPAKLFRVISIKKSGDFNFQLGAIEYQPLMYEDVVPNYGQIVAAPNVDASISNLTLTEVYQNGIATGSNQSSLVAVGWMPSNTTVGALVELQVDGGAWTTLANIAKGVGYTFTGSIGVTYTVRITGIDRAGNLGGTPAVASITVQAAANAPASVTGFNGVQSALQTVLTWSTATGADHYEIRFSTLAVPDWEAAAVLWHGTGTTWADATVRGSGSYMICAVSSLATGSVTSLTPALWNPASVAALYNANSLSASLAAATLGTVSGKLELDLPAATVYKADGTAVAVAAQSVIYPGTPAPNATYYTYAYLDAAMTLHAVPDPATASLPDTAPNASHAALAQNVGIVTLLCITTTNATGGTSGGGGGSTRLIGCTVAGTELEAEAGYESNMIIKARFDRGEVVRLRTPEGALEAIKTAEWIHADDIYVVVVAGFQPFFCSGSHTLFVEGEAAHRWCSTIQSGVKVATVDGYRRAVIKRVKGGAEVLRIEMAGPNHKYIVAGGVLTHNFKVAPPN